MSDETAPARIQSGSSDLTPSERDEDPEYDRDPENPEFDPVLQPAPFECIRRIYAVRMCFEDGDLVTYVTVAPKPEPRRCSDLLNEFWEQRPTVVALVLRCSHARKRGRMGVGAMIAKRMRYAWQ